MLIELKIVQLGESDGFSTLKKICSQYKSDSVNIMHSILHPTILKKLMFQCLCPKQRSTAQMPYSFHSRRAIKKIYVKSLLIVI